MSDFITDVEQQYELYCKIAEEHGFIDLNAKKNGFRCTTKSNEFNAGWIAFTGAVAAVRDEQQAKIEKLEIELSTTKQVLGNVIDMEVAKVDNLKTQLNNMEACYIEKKKQVEDQYKKVDGLQKENAALVHVIKSRDIQLENEKHEYDELESKLVDSKMKNTKLQKRVDAALEITKQGIRKQGGDYYLEKLEQALNGGDE